MEEVIDIRTLQCYQKATEEQRKKCNRKTANFKTSRRMDILYQALWRSEISEQRPPGNGIF